MRAVLAQVHAAFHGDEQRAIRGGRGIPGAGAAARDIQLRQSLLHGNLPRDGLGHRAAAGVAGTDEEDLHAGVIMSEARDLLLP